MGNTDDPIKVVLIMNANVVDNYQKELDKNPEFRVPHFDFIDHSYDPDSGAQYYVWTTKDTDSPFTKFVYDFVYRQPLEDYKFFVYVGPEANYQLGTYSENPFVARGIL